MAHAVVQGMGLGGGLCVAAVGGSAVQSVKETTTAAASSFSSFSGLRVSKQAEQPQHLTPASGAGASFPGSLCIRAVAAVNSFPRIPFVSEIFACGFMSLLNRTSVELQVLKQWIDSSYIARFLFWELGVVMGFVVKFFLWLSPAIIPGFFALRIYHHSWTRRSLSC